MCLRVGPGGCFRVTGWYEHQSVVSVCGMSKTRWLIRAVGLIVCSLRFVLWFPSEKVIPDRVVNAVLDEHTVVDQLGGTEFVW